LALFLASKVSTVLPEVESRMFGANTRKGPSLQSVHQIACPLTAVKPV